MGKWVGLTDDGHEGRWEWVTGEACVFTAWADGEPSRGFGGATESWVALWQNRDYRWNDAPRDLALPFICEWEPEAPAAKVGKPGKTLTLDLGPRPDGRPGNVTMEFVHVEQGVFTMGRSA